MNGLGDYVDFPGEPYLVDKLPSNSDAFVPLPGKRGMSGYDSIYGSNAMNGPETKTVVLRPRAGAPPGWPGFFGWLAATHPKFYDYARVALPNVAEDRQAFRTGAQSLDGYNDPAGQIAAFRGDFGDPASELMNGLGADELQAFTFSDLVQRQPTGQAATNGVTDGVPLPTSTGSSQIAVTLAQAASAFLPLYQQKKILDLQMARAKAGLPPLDTSSYTDANAGINVGLNKGTQNTVLMLGGLLVGGFLLFKVLGKR